MTPVFDQNGRVTNATPLAVFAACAAERDRLQLVRRAMFRATPVVFKDVGKHCEFLEAIGGLVGVHPHNIHVRGSGLFGFSTSPKQEKIWRRLDETRPNALSDIDVSVADVDLFDKWCAEADAWDAVNPVTPKTGGTARSKFLDRQKQRAANSIFSNSLSGNVCATEKAALGAFDTVPYCEATRGLSLLVFRDWASLEQRCIRDLTDLWEARTRLSRPPA